MDATVPYISMTDFVSEFCLSMFNDRRRYFLNYLVHAKWIWRELLQKSIYSVQSRYVKVDKTTIPYSIVLPKDLVRFINVSVENIYGDLHSLLMDNNINNVPLPVGNECSICGDTDDYGHCLRNLSTTTENVKIGNSFYVKKTWKKLFINGDLYEYREIPTVDQDENSSISVKTVTTSKLLSKLEVKSCGCVKKVESNKEIIYSKCGSVLPELQLNYYSKCSVSCQPKLGKIKVSGGRISFNGWVPDRVILTFQTNGDCNESEIMIPTFSVNAMMFGTAWRATAFAQNKSRFDKASSRVDYDRAVQELDEFLNPIRVEEFIAIQMSIPKWGYGTDEYIEPLNIDAMQSCNAIPEPGYTNTYVTNNYTSGSGSVSNPPFVQSTPALVWVYNHGLGYNPDITLTDLNDEVILGQVDFSSDKMTVTVSFNQAIAGKIYSR